MSSDADNARVCGACGKAAPTTETAYTLISSQHGWRVVVEKDPETGRRSNTWLCGDCWATRGKRPR